MNTRTVDELLAQIEKDLERSKQETTAAEAENFSIVSEAAAASLTSDALTVFDPIVSHTTHSEHVHSVLNEVDLRRAKRSNLFGGDAFYVAEKGWAIHQVEGKQVIVFKWSGQPKIMDGTSRSWRRKEGREFASILKGKGIDAIKYEGRYLKVDGTLNVNFAIIDNPQLLRPIGVYPKPPGNRASAISIPTIRGLQVLGAAGTGCALYDAGSKIIKSKNPAKEAAHQTILLSSAIWGGAVAASKAILPCASVGTAFPVAAPFTVPVCIASSSILGGVATASLTEVAWNAVLNSHTDEAVSVRTVTTVRTNTLTCQVSTMQDGARIGRCIMNGSQRIQEQQLTETDRILNENRNPTESERELSNKATTVTTASSIDHTDIYLTM